MAGSPPVLILDEPTNDLDPQRRKLVWDNLQQLNREQGTTIILVTHDAIEAEKAIQRVGILRSGKLVAVGRPSELKRQVDIDLQAGIAQVELNATSKEFSSGTANPHHFPNVCLNFSQFSQIASLHKRKSING